MSSTTLRELDLPRNVPATVGLSTNELIADEMLKFNVNVSTFLNFNDSNCMSQNTSYIFLIFIKLFKI